MDEKPKEETEEVERPVEETVPDLPEEPTLEGEEEKVEEDLEKEEDTE